MGRLHIKNIVEKSDTKSGRIFDFFILALIIFSIVEFSIETIPDLEAATRSLLKISEIIIVLLFTLEYVLRIYVADKKLSYIFSFYGLIDLIAILPFYMAIGIDLRSFRLFRLFRILRLLKLVKYSKSLQRLLIALKASKEEFILFFGLTIIIFYLSAVGIYFFENEAQPEIFKSIFHSMWWAVATLTTVGYGDVYPVTIGGKIFTTIMLLIGLGIVAIPAGIIASALTEVKSKEEKK